jgi:hypothetical protein
MPTINDKAKDRKRKQNRQRRKNRPDGGGSVSGGVP